MTDRTAHSAALFRKLHAPGSTLLLANAWDAGSARLIESCGALAIATTSAGLAWSRGYPDGDVLPVRVLASAAREIARVISVPLSVDFEGGYSDDPAAVAENVAAVLDAGAVGINIEDGSGPPDLLCAKIGAIRDMASRAGVDFFVNARTDVYLRALVPAEAARDEATARAGRYRDCGADGIFVPAVSDPGDIAAIVTATDLPLNVLVRPGLPTVPELRALGVRRVSAGSAISQAAYGLTRLAAREFLADGRYDTMSNRLASYDELDALFAPAS